MGFQGSFERRWMTQARSEATMAFDLRNRSHREIQDTFRGILNKSTEKLVQTDQTEGWRRGWINLLSLWQVARNAAGQAEGQQEAGGDRQQHKRRLNGANGQHKGREPGMAEGIRLGRPETHVVPSRPNPILRENKARNFNPPDFNSNSRQKRGIYRKACYFLNPLHWLSCSRVCTPSTRWVPHIQVG